MLMSLVFCSNLKVEHINEKCKSDRKINKNNQSDWMNEKSVTWKLINQNY